ncbi:hypothetical protein TTHERM_00992940 (macronuclear) [Tetrahymena thermophila SB210]|uniref:Uncharacterized protein n=1 Tax=Tetrahymena thermophila (strain SB210) TaxID=312017 RepID=Q22DA9_TETTS|nr:hypothetical protein TTHERM_00992940 [Tetrahymena thermophila SB210]EAR83293.2 hypothetical protein TTHERM_00992940 [Tetrahymena thermophila SB210]|eukprot:XP_001030956.2 hypothetical protein TTHERM_00992940 [Tetrahymena thermophila SB210]
MIMEQDSQITNNIDNLQAYCELLKQQGYNEEEIGQIIQQELNDQQEAFLSDKNEYNQVDNLDANQQQAYQQNEEEQDYYQEQMKNNKENQFNQHLTSEHEFQRIRQYDQHNYLIQPHVEQDENEDYSPIFSSFSQQQQYSYNQKQNIKDEQEIYNQQNNNENCRIVLAEKNFTNIMNKMPSSNNIQQNQFEQIQRNQSSKQQIYNEPISRGSISISNSQKDDSIQQFALLTSNERQSEGGNSQNKQTYKNQQKNDINLKNAKPSLQQWPNQQQFKQNKIIQKSDENNFNNSTANFIRNSYQNKIGEYQKIQNKSRSKTPTKVQKQVKSMSQEEKQLVELKNKLRTVFTFYVSFGDRINVNYLKSNKFHKMMSDAQLKDNVILTQNRLDLMFVKENHNKHNMDFDTFLTLIAKIAILKFPQYTDAQALQMILQNHFLPLYDNIMAETDLGEDEVKFKEPIDEGPLFILKEITPVIQLIYQHYFPFEWKNRGNEAQVKQKSETAIFQFLKEYDICPNLITKSSAFLLFREILDTQIDNLCRNPQLTNLSGFLSEDQGQCFTFWKYAIYLIRIANVCYSNLFNQLEQPAEGANRTIAEKLAFLLERMELSAGFLNLDKKNLSHQSLIIKKKVLNRMLSNGSIIGSCQISSLNSQLAFNNNIGGQYSLNLQQPSNNSNNVTDTLSNLQTNQENSSVQSQTSSRVTRSRSDLRLRQSANGLTEMQQQCVRNYSPMGFTNYSQKLNEQQRQVMIAHIQNMQNYKLFKNPLGLADIQCVENIQLIDQFSDRLLTIFQSYCSFGDAMNTQWMKSSKYTKLMREANIININTIQNQGSVMQNQNSLQACSEDNNRYLTGCDIDLIFIKASKKRSAQTFNQASQSDLNKQDTIKQQQRLDFEQFLVSLEMVAQKLYKEISLQEGLSQLLQNNILPVLEREVNSNDNKKNNSSSISKSVHSSTQNEHVSILMEILKDQEIVELLGMIHKTMMVYFKYYSQNKNTIDFDKFVKFCKDFGIFPDIIPKSRLLKIFNTLAQIYNTTEMAQIQLQNSSNYNEKPVIDQHLFIEAIALCAFEVPYSDPQPNEIEKICYLVERMNQSGGQIFIQKQIGHTRSQSSSSVSWDIIQPIRKKYPHLFNSNNYSQFNTQNQLSYQNGLINSQISQIYQPQNSMQKANMFDDIMKRNLKIQNQN